jgi:hypothetical protein
VKTLAKMAFSQILVSDKTRISLADSFARPKESAKLILVFSH